MLTDLILKLKGIPYANIGNYMHRRWLMPRWLLRHNPTTQRLEPRSWVPLAIRINHILRPDADPYLHDHPWDWRTFVLRGWYVEEDAFGQLHRRNPGDTAARRAHEPHRIVEVAPLGCITLFITFRPYNHWGFYAGSPARKVSHLNYKSPNSRES